MAKARSPGYPTIGLKEAIEKVEQVYHRDYQNALPREVVAAHMGYTSLNGKSLGILSALSKFGLLEGRGNDTRVSDLAVKIIAHPPGTLERGEALREAASAPELFAELDAKFASGKASDQALRSFLLTQKFIPPAAEAAIRAYRETKTLVQGEPSDYGAALPEEPTMQHSSPDPAPASAALKVAPLPTTVSLSDEPYSVSLTPGGGMEVFARLKTVDDAEALRDDIDGFITLLRNRQKREKGREAAPAPASVPSGMELRDHFLKANNLDPDD